MKWIKEEWPSDEGKRVLPAGGTFCIRQHLVRSYTYFRLYPVSDPLISCSFWSGSEEKRIKRIEKGAWIRTTECLEWYGSRLRKTGWMIKMLAFPTFPGILFVQWLSEYITFVFFIPFNTHYILLVYSEPLRVLRFASCLRPVFSILYLI